MKLRKAFAATAALALVSALAMACGGGGATKDAGNGQRITDPARVPSSTPIQNPVLYQIRNDGRVDSSGGPPTTVSPSGTQTVSPAKTYVVKSGDTCGAIASQNGVTLDELKKANRTIDEGCTNIHAGDTLKIPATVATPTSGTVTTGGDSATKPSGKTYTVAGGDSCSTIAASYGVAVAQLISLNGIDADCKNLKIGQVLKIP